MVHDFYAVIADDVSQKMQTLTEKPEETLLSIYTAHGEEESIDTSLTDIELTQSDERILQVVKVQAEGVSEK